MAELKPKILAIEDEPEIRRFLRAALVGHGFDWVEAVAGEEGVRQAAMQQPDLVILDLGLPDIDGLEVIRQIRGWSKAPIVVLSARGQESDKIAALDLGADDYLTKPFGVGELLARIRVALRHAARVEAGQPGESVVEAGNVRIDLAARLVTRAGVEVKLTKIEFDLLAALARHAGKVVTHRQLLKEVWGPHSVDEPHYVRVYMANLRKKLEDNPARPTLLHTEQGVGYRLREQNPAD